MNPYHIIWLYNLRYWWFYYLPWKIFSLSLISPLLKFTVTLHYCTVIYCKNKQKMNFHHIFLVTRIRPFHFFKYTESYTAFLTEEKKKASMIEYSNSSQDFILLFWNTGIIRLSEPWWILTNGVSPQGIHIHLTKSKVKLSSQGIWACGLNYSSGISVSVSIVN